MESRHRVDVLDEESGAETLGAWKRYRALNDAMGEVYELLDINLREGRFALIMMGGLNAGALVAASRSDLLSAIAPSRRVWLIAFICAYAIVALYFMLQAVAALRPGHFRPRLNGWAKDRADYPQGVRYFEDVIARSPEDYWCAWQTVSLDQLNSELAVQLHSVCIKLNDKRRLLKRLYAGLRIMTLMLGILVVIFVFSAWR
jgi:hypothetical protein